jgi:cysteine synthase A
MKHWYETPRLDPDVIAGYPALAPQVAKIGVSDCIEIATEPGHGRIFAKCEWMHPGGSIKDRTALALLWSALCAGLDPQRDTLLEYSGGQLGIALSRLTAAIGLRTTLVLSDATPASMIETMIAQHAQIELVPKEQGFWGVMERARVLSETHPDWWFLNQHRNRANLLMHYQTTGAELLTQLPVPKVDAWVASIGTGGTLIGVMHRLRERYPALCAYGVTPAEMPYATPQPPNTLPKFAGSGGLGCGRKQPFVMEVEAQLQGHFHVSYPDALRTMIGFRRETGLMLGSSAAACLGVARELAARLGRDGVVATLFASAGAREEWAKAEQLHAEEIHHHEHI